MSAYQTRQIKRVRATKTAMEERRTAIADIVIEIAPCTVRQVFYQATVRGIVEKTEEGYGKVQRMLVEMRRNGDIGYADIVDNTRWMRKPRTFDSLQDALDQTAALYRRSLWTNASDYVEIWLEKDALAGVITPITAKYDVPLMVARGYASLSYHLGDFDPSGVNAGEKIEETLRELAPDADITFERIAVNQDQIIEWKLPGRPTKASDSRARKFGHAESVELDAIHPDDLRQLVEDVIVVHLDENEIAVLKTAEGSEREILKAFAHRGGGSSLAASP